MPVTTGHRFQAVQRRVSACHELSQTLQQFSTMCHFIIVNNLLHIKIGEHTATNFIKDALTIIKQASWETKRRMLHSTECQVQAYHKYSPPSMFTFTISLRMFK